MIAAVKQLLYLTDRFHNGTHVVHMTFLVESKSGTPSPLGWEHIDEHASNSSGLVRQIKMVPFNELTSRGFPAKFAKLTVAGFPSRGYKGDFQRFYGRLRKHVLNH